MQGEARLAALKEAYGLGKVEILLPEAEVLLAPYKHDEADGLRLVRRLMEVEVAALTAVLEEQAAKRQST
jgi:hypothetical protein